MFFHYLLSQRDVGRLGKSSIKKRIFYGQADRNGWPPPLWSTDALWRSKGADTVWICKCPWPRTTDGNSLCSPQSSPTAANLAGVLPHIQVIMLMIILTWKLWSWLWCDIYGQKKFSSGHICDTFCLAQPKSVYWWDKTMYATSDKYWS